jgi:hypothetical protein
MKSLGTAALFLFTATVAYGQQPAATPGERVAPAAAPAASRTAGRRAVARPGQVNVARVSDSSFVVVKDHGAFQTTMFFTVEGGIPILKHRAKYYYPET